MPSVSIRSRQRRFPHLMRLSSALENNITYGGMPKWFRGQMLAFAIFFIVIALVHLAALVVPFLRGPMSRSRHTWVARVKDVGVYSQPYLVPNGRVFASTFSMIASVRAYSASALQPRRGLTVFLLQVFVVQILLELYAPRRFNTAFMLIPLLPFYVTVWMSNFDALFAIWVSPIAHSHSWTDRLKHPWILNPLCWGVPTVVVIMESVFIARLWTLYSTLARDVWALVADLEQAETVFRQQGLGAVDFAELASMGDKVKCACGLVLFVQLGTQIDELPRGTFVSYNKRQAGALLSWSIWLVIASLVRAFRTAGRCFPRSSSPSQLFFASLFLLVKTIHIRRGFPSRHGTGTNGPVFSKGSTTVHCRASPSRIRAQRLLLGYMSSLAALLVTFTVTVALTASLSWKARNLDAK